MLTKTEFEVIFEIMCNIFLQNNIVDFLLPGKNLLLHSAVVDQVASSRWFCSHFKIFWHIYRFIFNILGRYKYLSQSRYKYLSQAKYLCRLCGWISSLLQVVFWGEKPFKILFSHSHSHDISRWSEIWSRCSAKFKKTLNF